MLKEIYVKQQKSGIKQGETLPSTPDGAPPTNYHLIFVPMLIGLVAGCLILGPVLALYIEQKSRCNHIS
jgi:hypothetical protein